MNVIKIKPLCLLDCLLIILVILNRAATKLGEAEGRLFYTIEKTWRGV